MKSGFYTSEFWISIVTLVVGMVTAMYGLTPTESGALQDMLAKGVVAVGGLIGSAVVIYRYIKSRHDLKTLDAIIESEKDPAQDEDETDPTDDARPPTPLGFYMKPEFQAEETEHDSE